MALDGTRIADTGRTVRVRGVLRRRIAGYTRKEELAQRTEFAGAGVEFLYA